MNIREITVAFAVLAMSVVSAGASSDATASEPGSPKVHYTHMFVIVLENHSRDSVIGDLHMPYITSLAQQYGVANKYYGVTHPSEPNYVAMISGDNFGVNNDDAANRFEGENLIDQLELKHHTWAAYMESAPSAGYAEDYWPSQVDPLYASKHNPFVLFKDIRNNPNRMAKIKPYTDFTADMHSNHVPEFVYIVPNQCHDMHGGVNRRIAADGSDGTPCPYGNGPNDPWEIMLKVSADGFVKQTVKTIMTSKAWTTGDSAIFIVADESDYDINNKPNHGWPDVSGCCDSPELPPGSPAVGPEWPGGVYGGGLSPAIVVTTHGRPVVSIVPYNHYSLLTTIEDNWNLGYLGHAGDRAGGVFPMNDLLAR